MTAGTTRLADCPKTSVLADLAGARLDEHAAGELFAHIDACDTCQKRLDEVSARLPKLGQATPEARRSQVGNLSRLIKNAQTIQTQETTETPLQKDHVDLPAFFSALKQCGLFEGEEVSALQAEADERDTSSLARRLVQEKRLTRFQARALMRGKWKGLVLGNYVILEKLGQGGMGSVFKARHRRLGRIVCVKVMNLSGRKSPTMLERFRQEARTVAAIKHRDFVLAHDADEAEGVPFLVMEFIEGDDLERQVSKNGPLPWRESLDIIRRVALALQDVHETGMTHRDIKPHNLMTPVDHKTGQQRIKVLDLGLARFDSLLSDPDSSMNAAMTNTGVIMGTVDYMAPEQAIRSRDADNRSDIYSLGCTLHFLLTGKPIFDGDTVMARLVAHREKVVPSLQEQCFGSPQHLDSVFFRMVAKAPEHRYQAMSDVADDLQALLNEETPAAAGQATHQQQESVLDQVRRRRRHRGPRVGVWLFALLAFLGVCFGTWKAFGPAEPTPAPNEIADTAEPDSGQKEITTSEPIPFVRPQFGNSGLLTRGSGGVALVVLPFRDVNTKELMAWQDALAKADIADVQYASSKSGEPILPKQFSLRATDIDRVSIDNYDMILLTGGSVSDFDNTQSSAALSSLLASAFPRGVVIGIFRGSEYEAAKEATSYCDFEKEDTGLVLREPFAEDGWMIEASSPEFATDLVERSKAFRLQLRERNDNPLLKTPFTGKEAKMRVHGGGGRALVVIPFNDYSMKEYKMFRRELVELGMDIHVASSQFGTAQPAGGSKNLWNPTDEELEKDPHAGTPITRFPLRNFDAKDFDYIFALSGNYSEFNEDGSAFEEWKRVVEEAQASGIVFAALSRQSQQAFKDVGLTKSLKRQQGSKGIQNWKAEFRGEKIPQAFFLERSAEDLRKTDLNLFTKLLEEAALTRIDLAQAAARTK